MEESLPPWIFIILYRRGEAPSPAEGQHDVTECSQLVGASLHRVCQILADRLHRLPQSEHQTYILPSSYIATLLHCYIAHDTLLPVHLLWANSSPQGITEPSSSSLFCLFFLDLVLGKRGSKRCKQSDLLNLTQTKLV
ncbi:hypothetical protein RRG08_001589 [Elysia crispata]|uniref:Uncharacterized protein n=1 Tax=Elysia crispata TaxID=231223 RepID=A0AAE1AKA8_9GAST|nr:hypothetical protein RRG08_001589 [Elysia crispata]